MYGSLPAHLTMRREILATLPKEACTRPVTRLPSTSPTCSIRWTTSPIPSSYTLFLKPIFYNVSHMWASIVVFKNKPATNCHSIREHQGCKYLLPTSVGIKRSFITLFTFALTASEYYALLLNIFLLEIQCLSISSG